MRAPLVDVFKALLHLTRHLALHERLGLALQAHALLVDALDAVQRRVLARRDLAIEVIDVDVRRDGHLARGERLEQAGLAAAVGAEKAVAPVEETEVYGRREELATAAAGVAAAHARAAGAVGGVERACRAPSVQARNVARSARQGQRTGRG